MLYDKTVLKAVSGIKQRSERHGRLDVVSKTFVDSGILLEVANTNHQVIFGRRGTGKTHLLRMLQAEKIESDSFSCFIDCRTVGSTNQATDQNGSIKSHSFSIFRDILSEIHESLLNRIVDLSPDNSDFLLAELDSFLTEFSKPHEIIKSVTVTDSSKEGNSTDSSAGAGAAVAGRIGFDLSRRGNRNSEVSDSFTYSVEFDEKAIFLSISKQLNKLVGALNGPMVILLDEWSSIPINVQPYLAEFIKRALLPASNITLKIAAIEFRSTFLVTANDQYVGIELGADVSTAPSMDSFYSYAMEGKQLEDTFSEMLYRHISSELPFDYLRKRYKVYDGETLMHSIFDAGAFATLTLASEGVIRDLINIFTIAFSRVMKLNSYERTRITSEIIYDSARRWFERDKMQGLSSQVRGKYMSIIRQAISNNKSRYFLVPRDNLNTQTLDQLVDLRVLHLTSDSFISFANDLATYRVYNIDFGSYASLIDFDDRAKHGSVPFFDTKKFSRYPDQMEDIERFMVNESHLK